ncbi:MULTISPECIES: exopolyphosphatase [Aeromonas]|jgi:exopolyphosphatase/guanosine-5'-triphosphate,3'-diphosphate pyrophosphatase|uniref:Exopolyphosphatase n=1 Tax=Aeromonas media TaxID=651 RepID=A0A7Z3CTA3_AERME|nr:MULTISPECIES: exopolyphosphatase [Aeromonas]MBP6361355.1 exopolyphosphatase [Aeromonas sp.]MBP4065512.1 exopolyphosphatase [Aeromonas sp. MaB10011B]MBP4077933.1 exopolyphosphatase [Aeromonas sp. MrichA-1]MBP8112725.1 exopolyphosphatase [Aeromonas sp.]MBP9677486.1 exopolyphosphatase [Aeromonas sp.]
MDNSLYAAVDLGSNSFHMVIARLTEGRMQIIDRIKERVRLAEGMDGQRRMSPEAMARGLDCLALFAERLTNIKPDQIRIAGTYTLRRASNARDFVREAAKVLNHPIEIISGQEEARLIYQGVAHTQHIEGQVLVVDIGGGSTELIIGEGFEHKALTSRKMGCVSFTQSFFGNGKLGEKAFNAAVLEAQHQLAPIINQYRKLGWQSCLGSSGSIRTVRDVLQGEEWTDGAITLAGLERLKEEMLKHKRVDQLKLAGLTEERQGVFAAAVAILLGLFTSLPIERMEYSDGALREGLLYEFEERLQHHDIRERTALALSTHYRIDKRQATRVESSVLSLFDALSGPWEMPEEPYRAILGWAARLHEIGLAINYSGIHKHSAYILQNTDLPGFNQDDQALLAALVRFHRKGLKLSELPALPNHDEQTVLRCIRILRLAVAAHHRRQDNLLPEWNVQAAGDQLVVTLPLDWCDENKLLMQNLEKEHRYCHEQGWPLLFQLG